MSDNVDVNEVVSDKKQATDPRFNMAPAIVEVPGTPYDLEMRKWNKPYRYQPFPKMVYKADRFQGTLMCGNPDPKPYEYQDERSYKLGLEAARAFTDRCQFTVNNEYELNRALEQGWREHPSEALAFANERENKFSTSVAHRLYEDRNMGEKAKAESAAAEAAVGEPLAEIPRQPADRMAKARAARAAKRAAAKENPPA